MKKSEHIEKLIPLYFYDELPDEAKNRFERHVSICDACHVRVEEFKDLQTLLEQKVSFEPTESLLEESRLKLRGRLQEQRAAIREPWWERVSDFFLLNRLTVEFTGAAALVLLGLFLGQAVWSAKESPLELKQPLAADVIDADIREPLISDIDLIEYDPTSGKVTVKYKRVNDVHLQGNIEDASIRNILSYAIRRETNPGRRLTAVKALSRGGFRDNEAEDALIHAMRNDNVDGVRLKAAQVLKAIPMNEKIKKAFIHALSKDPNPAVRIEAVDALSGIDDREEVAPIFRNAARDDENEFIRLITSKIVQENKPSKIEKRVR
ncbi:MAG: HEAT repeat domain-containing protein [bacterium]